MMATHARELGKIDNAFFGLNDRTFLTFMIQFKFGSSGQGFGNYALDSYDKAKKRRTGHACGTDLVIRLLELFGVSELKQIEGRYAYALREKEGWGPIVGIQLPEADGGKKFLISDWQQEWFPGEVLHGNAG